MRVLVDENLPVRFFSELLSEFEICTVRDLGWSGMKNGELLKRVEGAFEVFVTADKNLRYQQSLTGRSFAIVEIFTNRLPMLKEWSDAIREGIRSVSGNGYFRIGPEPDSADNSASRRA